VKSKKGTGTTYLEYSPGRIKKMKQTKKKTEERWAAKSGEVITRMQGDPKISPPPPKKYQ
jgi:hypothetical protein